MYISIFVIRDSLRSRGLAYCLYEGEATACGQSSLLGVCSSGKTSSTFNHQPTRRITMSKTHKDLVQFKAKQDHQSTPKPRKHGARYKREQVQKREWKSGLEYRLGRDD
jgi:hypothetical protein